MVFTSYTTQLDFLKYETLKQLKTQKYVTSIFTYLFKFVLKYYHNPTFNQEREWDTVKMNIVVRKEKPLFAQMVVFYLSLDLK